MKVFLALMVMLSSSVEADEISDLEAKIDSLWKVKEGLVSTAIAADVDTLITDALSTWGVAVSGDGDGAWIRIQFPDTLTASEKRLNIGLQAELMDERGVEDLSEGLYRGPWRTIVSTVKKLAKLFP